MSDLQKKILDGASFITTQKDVCGITKTHVGDLFTYIGTELGVLDTSKETPAGAQTKATKAKDDALRAANSYTDSRDTAVRSFIGQVETGLHSITESLTRTKADKTETVISAGEVYETPYDTFHKSQIVYYPGKSGAPTAPGPLNAGLPGESGGPGESGEVGNPGYPGGNTGTFVQFCTLDRGIALQADDTNERFFISNFIPQPRNPTGPTPQAKWVTCELLHKGNFEPKEYANIVCAGKVSGGNSPSRYMGLIFGAELTTTANRYKVTHGLGSVRYMVTVTPHGTTARYASIVTKDKNYFEVQFASGTDFEFQMTKY